MPTNSTTVTDQDVGSEVATWTITENAISKHIQRVMIDNRLNIPAKRYAVLAGPSTGIVGVATAGANYVGIRKLAANPDALLTRIQILQYNAAAGNAVPLLLWRATTVAGGTLIALANVPRLDTTAGTATLEVRHGAVTGTKSGQPMLTFGPSGTGAIGQSSQSWVWDSSHIGERIELTADEGLILDSPIAGNIANRYFVTVEWEEV